MQASNLRASAKSSYSFEAMPTKRRPRGFGYWKALERKHERLAARDLLDLGVREHEEDMQAAKQQRARTAELVRKAEQQLWRAASEAAKTRRIEARVRRDVADVHPQAVLVTVKRTFDVVSGRSTKQQVRLLKIAA